MFTQLEKLFQLEELKLCCNQRQKAVCFQWKPFFLLLSDENMDITVTLKLRLFSLCILLFTIDLIYQSKTKIRFEMCFQLQLHNLSHWNSCMCCNLVLEQDSSAEVQPPSDIPAYVCVSACACLCIYMFSRNTQQGSPCLPLLVCLIFMLQIDSN